MSGLAWRVDKAERTLAIPSPEDVAQIRKVVDDLRISREWALAGSTCGPCAAGLDLMACRLCDEDRVLEATRDVERFRERLVYEFDRALPHHCCVRSLLRAIETGGPPSAPHKCQVSD